VSECPPPGTNNSSRPVLLQLHKNALGCPLSRRDPHQIRCQAICALSLWWISGCDFGVQSRFWRRRRALHLTPQRPLESVKVKTGVNPGLSRAILTPSRRHSRCCGGKHPQDFF
jgi:hypothetical protein